MPPAIPALNIHPANGGITMLTAGAMVYFGRGYQIWLPGKLKNRQIISEMPDKIKTEML